MREDAPTPLTVDGSEHYLAITLPSREHPAYSTARELLAANGFVLDPSTKKWWLRDRHRVLNFLATHGDALRSRFHADYTPNFEKHSSVFAAADVRAEVEEAGDGEFTVSVGISAGRVGDD